MSNEPHSIPESEPPRPLSGSSAARDAHRHDTGSSSLGNLTSSALRGLAEILESFFAAPDFHGLYEHDPRKRVIHAWARVGDSMQLALGRPVTLKMTYPDGRRTRRVVGPESANPEHRAALDKVRQTMESPDRDDADQMIVVSLTRQQAEGLMACVEGVHGRPEQ